MRRAALLLTLSLCACGRGPDRLVASFQDELVEAPARTVEVVAVGDTGCRALLDVAHADVAEVGTVLARSTARYPVNPESEVLQNLPRGRPLALDVAARDGGGLQIARGCVEATLAPSEPTRVEVALSPWPDCGEDAPRETLDLAIVLDTSQGMRDANIGLEGQLIARLNDFVQNLGVSGGVETRIVVHGHVEPSEHLAPTSEQERVLEALGALEDVNGGAARHFEAVSLASNLLRARARCGHRPVILWMGGGADASEPAALQIATIGLVGTRGVFFDDIYVYGVGVSEEAVGNMRALLDPVELADVEGALTNARLAEALSNARYLFEGLVDP